MKADRENRGSSLVVHLAASLLVFSLYAVLVWQVSGPFLAWLAYQKSDGRDLAAAVKYDKRNPTYRYLSGRQAHYDFADADAGKAAEQYRRSLELNPLQPGVWMDLAKAFQQLGRAAEAEHAYERAVRLSPTNAELLWEAGTFWLMNSAPAKAVDALKKAIIVDPALQVSVYDLCWKIGLGNAYIREQVVPRSYPYQREYLKYLMAANRVAEAIEVWNGMERDDLEKDLFLSYVNFLIANKSYDSARSAWQEITALMSGKKTVRETAESLVWNQSFEQEMLNGGFDWIVSEAEGVRVFVDESVRMTGNRSLGVHFDGEHNPDITVARQIVPVAPGLRYGIRAQIRTDSLTTSNGIFLHVRGHDCPGLDRSSEAVTGSNFWREVSIDFEAPSGCNAVMVMIRRAKSAKLDNKIEGTAWIDGVVLRQQISIGTSGSRKP